MITRRDLLQAAAAAAAGEGCDYATLSPIFVSASKPGYGPALGVGALRDAPLPVYALGGVDPSNALFDSDTTSAQGGDVIHLECPLAE